MLQNNPLDNVEDVLRDNNWVFTRMSDEKLQLEIRGSSCDYDILFFWQDSLNALQLVCAYDMQLGQENFMEACKAINTINTAMMIGHFELDADNLRPCFRHSCFMKRGDTQSIEDFVDLSLMQCEQNQPVFAMLASNEAVCSDMISFALMDPQGES